MNDQAWSWIVTIVGVIGFYLAGRKVWWAWYVNIANQILWFAFAVITEQWGFLLGIPLYMTVFVKNAYSWTKEELEKRKQDDPAAEVAHRLQQTWTERQVRDAKGRFPRSKNSW